jgi:hypothetical protein
MSSSQTLAKNQGGVGFPVLPGRCVQGLSHQFPHPRRQNLPRRLAPGKTHDTQDRALGQPVRDFAQGLFLDSLFVIQQFLDAFRRHEYSAIRLQGHRSILAEGEVVEQPEKASPFLGTNQLFDRWN